jgi:hypothetical protein
LMGVSRCSEYRSASAMRTFWHKLENEMLARPGSTRFVDLNRSMTTCSMLGLKKPGENRTSSA